MPTIAWKKPIELKHSGGLTYEETDRLKPEAGIYFFSRRYNEGNYQPFYIGKSLNVRTRLYQYKNSGQKHERRIRDAVEGRLDAYSGVRVGSGARYYHFGLVTPVPGQNMRRVIGFAERALIQYARIVGWNIINNHHAGQAAYRQFETAGTRFDELLPTRLIMYKDR